MPINAQLTVTLEAHGNEADGKTEMLEVTIAPDARGDEMDEKLRQVSDGVYNLRLVSDEKGVSLCLTRLADGQATTDRAAGRDPFIGFGVSVPDTLEHLGKAPFGSVVVPPMPQVERPSHAPEPCCPEHDFSLPLATPSSSTDVAALQRQLRVYELLTSDTLAEALEYFKPEFEKAVKKGVSLESATAKLKALFDIFPVAAPPELRPELMKTAVGAFTVAFKEGLTRAARAKAKKLAKKKSVRKTARRAKRSRK